MISLAGFKRGFTSCWRIALLGLLVISVFIRLGFWQLQRADEKKQMLLSHQRQADQSPVLMSQLDKSPMQYQTIRVRGQFLSHVLLLDNQHYQHRFGYHVISPLMLANGHVILVDRGWLAGDVSRQALPTIETIAQPTTLLGSVYYPSENRWQTGPLVEKQQGNSVVIERLDIKLISHFLHKPVYPFIIHLGPHERGGYVRDWSIVSMPPERHYAYAIQWFGIALIMFVILVMWCFKSRS